MNISEHLSEHAVLKENIRTAVITPNFNLKERDIVRLKNAKANAKVSGGNKPATHSDGTTYITAPFNSAYQIFNGNKSFSVSIWARSERQSLAYYLDILMGQCTDTGGGGRKWYFNYSGGGGTLHFHNGNNEIDSDAISVSLNVWHLCILTFNKDTQNYTFYFDGNQVGVRNNGQAGNGDCVTPLQIGYGEGGYTPPYFKGDRQEALIFNRELSSSEAAILWNTGVGVYGDVTQSPWNSGLVAAYHFMEGTGQLLDDYSTTANDANANGGTWVFDGKIIDPLAPSDSTAIVSALKYEDVATQDTAGKVTLSDKNTETVIEGKSINLNISGTSVLEISNSNVTFNQPLKGTLWKTSAGSQWIDADNRIIYGPANSQIDMTNQYTLDTAGAINWYFLVRQFYDSLNTSYFDYDTKQFVNNRTGEVMNWSSGVRINGFSNNILGQGDGYTIVESDDFVFINGGSVYLPDDAIAGKVYRVKNISTNQLRVISNTGSIDGEKSQIIGKDECMEVCYEGGTYNWYIT